MTRPDAKPRLLYVVTLAETGGAQSYVRDLLTAAQEEYEVTLAAHGTGPLRDAAVAVGVEFVPLHQLRRALHPIHDPLAILELRRLFRRVRPEIVHLNSSKAGVLGRLAAAWARVPVRIFTAHGWAFKATGGVAATIYLWADRLVRPLTSNVICVSQTELRAGLAARVCTAGRATVIRNAVEVPAVPERSPAPDDTLRIVSVGRLAEPKDFSTLVRALAALPPGSARLQVLGDGPLRPELEAEIASLGIGGAIELVGEVPDVRPYLRKADVFVLSSRSEGMPLAVLEAMAAGLPVIASDVGGLAEVVVEGETGYLVPAADPAALADRLAALAADPERRAALAAASHRRAEEHFSLPRWRAAHLELYRSLRRAG